MKFKTVWFLVAFLSVSFEAKASICDDNLLERSDIKAVYSVPPSLLIGEDVVQKVIAAENEQDPIFTEFMRDERFSSAGLDLSAPNWRIAYDFLALKHHSISSYFAGLPSRVGHIGNLSAGAGRRSPIYFVTWESIGIRPLNRLFDRRTYPMALIEKGGNVDGRWQDPPDHMAHDGGHALGFEAKINGFGPATFSNRFYDHFRYNAIVKNLSESDHVLFDIGYFIIMHEKNGTQVSTLIDYEKRELSTAEIQALYAKAYSSISFDFSNGVRASIIADYKTNLTKRFLDDKDLGLVLPIEVRRKLDSVRDHESKVEIAEAFINECLTFFFQKHYEATLMNLAKHR